MNILCIGHFDKFSRFFIGIESALKKNHPDVKLRIESLFLSSYLYAVFHHTSGSLVSFKAWFNALRNKKKYLQIIKISPTHKGILLESLLCYHTKLNSNISKTNLLIQAISYIDILHKEFTRFKPDIVLLIGDSKLAMEVTTKLAEIFNTKVYFIEQGPYKTTFFDSKGVNANASIKDFDFNKTSKIFDSEEKTINAFINRSKPKAYNRSPIYRGIDLLFEFILKNSSMYPPDLKYTDTFPLFSKKSKVQLTYPTEIQDKNKTFLLVLQVPMDVNMILHSPNFKNHSEIVKAVHENLPQNSQLIIREHPVFKGKYSKEIYDYIENEGLIIDSDRPLAESMSIADVVIVNNSTVGLEAIANLKTVVVLGEAYYGIPELCILYNRKNDLKCIFEDALMFKPKKEYINMFLNEFFFNYLIDGFITDDNLKASSEIAKKISIELSKSKSLL